MKIDSRFTTRLSPLSILALSVVCSFFSISSYAQNWIWAKGEGDIGDDVSSSVTMDENGNAYMTGNIAGKGNFSGTVYQGKGIYDVFIAKYDPQGNVIWVKTAGGSDDDEGKAIRYSSNYIYVTGYFRGSASFESTLLTSQGDADIFIAKYDLNGNLIWAKQAAGAGEDIASSIDADAAGNIFVGGSYRSALTLGPVQLTSVNPDSESFYAKYDAAGNLVWAKSVIGTNSNFISGLAFDNHNSVFLTGYFSGSFKIGAATLNSSSQSYDIFLAKIDLNGNLEWIKRAGSTDEDAAQGVCSDKDGNPSIVGYFRSTANFGSNSVTYRDYNDIFVAHYDASGNNLWVRAGKGQKLDVGNAIAVDGNGNIFATGMFQDAVVFDGHTLTGNAKDIFVVSYNPGGTVRWVEKAGSTGTDCALGIDVANSGVVTVSGYYLLYCSFGSITIDYAQNTDLFIAEFYPPAVGIKELADLQVSLSPNPISDAAVCRLTLDNSEESTIKILDVLGNEILKEVFHSTFTIHPTALSSGIYLVEVANGLKRKTLRLIRQ